MKQTFLFSLLLFSMNAFCQDSAMTFINHLDKSLIKEFLKDAKQYKGVPLPNFILEDTAGNKIRLTSQKNKLFLIHFWYTHCQSCLAEITYYQNIVSYYKDSPDIAFISICVDRGMNKALWKGLIAKYALTDKQLFLDVDKRVAPVNRFYRGIAAFPTYLVADSNYMSLGCNTNPDNDIGFIYVLERARAGVAAFKGVEEQMNMTPYFQQWANAYLRAKNRPNNLLIQ